MRGVAVSGQFTSVDLFAGAGGLSLGFENAGFEVIAAVELDKMGCLNLPSKLQRGAGLR